MIPLAFIAITVYAQPYIGGPLYCGGVYDDAQVPWVAAPVGGPFECGERVGILLDGTVYVYVVGDFGPFGDNCVVQPDGECLPIALDIPKSHAPFEGLSAVGRVWSVDRVRERWERYR